MLSNTKDVQLDATKRFPSRPSDAESVDDLIGLSSCSDDLLELADMLFDESVRFTASYLFAGNSEPELAALTTPLSLSHSIMFHVVEDALDLSDYRTTYQTLYVPSHSITDARPGGFSVTVGAVVQRNYGPVKDKSSGGLSTGRFLRNNNTLAHADFQSSSANPDVLNLFYYRPTSTVGIRQLYVTLDRAKFEASMRTSNRPLFLSSIGMCMSRGMLRNCSICHQPPLQLCGCSLPRRPPKHPLDFSHASDTLNLLTGTFCGQMTTRFNSHIPLDIVRSWRTWWTARGEPAVSRDCPVWKSHVVHYVDIDNKVQPRIRFAQVGLSACTQGLTLLSTEPRPVAAGTKRKTTAIAPRTKTISPGEHSPKGERAPDSTYERVLTAERAEILRKRKERNRLAAARSNARRKAESDERKRVLAEARARVRLLQARKAELEQENEKLREEALGTALRIMRSQRSQG